MHSNHSLQTFDLKWTRVINKSWLDSKVKCSELANVRWHAKSSALHAQRISSRNNCYKKHEQRYFLCLSRILRQKARKNTVLVCLKLVIWMFKVMNVVAPRRRLQTRKCKKSVGANAFQTQTKLTEKTQYQSVKHVSYVKPFF